MNNTHRIISMVAIICTILSCCTLPKKKPFVVIYKSSPDKLGIAWFGYQDFNGELGKFEDSAYKYHVGDTLP